MPGSSVIGVIAGVKSELAALAGIRDATHAPKVRLSGARPACAESEVRALIDAGCIGILSFGVCGALDPRCRPGDLIVADAVVAPDDTRMVCDQAWSACLAAALDTVPRTIQGSDSVVGAGTKRRAFAATQAAAVDMESHIAAKLATQYGLPFAVLRAVADPADMDIPAWIFKTVQNDGSISLPAVLGGVLTHPLQIGALIALGNANKRAMASLSGAVVRLGPTLGFLAR